MEGNRIINDRAEYTAEFCDSAHPLQVEMRCLAIELGHQHEMTDNIF
jgi:hypothetical protein